MTPTAHGSKEIDPMLRAHECALKSQGLSTSPGLAPGEMTDRFAGSPPRSGEKRPSSRTHTIIGTAPRARISAHVAVTEQKQD